jgi:threonylcarbamoyladenosine tRNA methylthiotransferase MtaB
MSAGPRGPAPEGIEVVNFGCRLNLVEGEAMRRAALAAGRRDIAIVNTCGVTGEAVRQARQTIRRLKREAPARGIFVTGCASEMEPGGFSAMPEVDGVVGNGMKTARETWSGGTANLDLDRSPLEEGFEDHTRAFLAVQNGCDHRCTFCAIPFGRGVSRSAPLEDVAAAAARLAGRGFHEIVLTGVDLTSYGTDLPERPVLGTLVRAILKSAPGLARLRLSSIDCIEADAELLAAFAEEDRLMPYLHLSLQSGDDMILKRMKRRHARADAVALCDELRRLRPDMAFGADLIAGFPTETPDMAANTLALIEDCGLTFLHVFPFSPRPGTPAAKMPPVSPPLVKERARRLREAGDAALRRHLRARIGRTLPVLAERGGIGRAPDFTPVSIGRASPGSFTKVVVSGHDGRKLFGKCLDDF